MSLWLAGFCPSDWNHGYYVALTISQSDWCGTAQVCVSACCSHRPSGDMSTVISTLIETEMMGRISPSRFFFFFFNFDVLFMTIQHIFSDNSHCNSSVWFTFGVFCNLLDSHYCKTIFLIKALQHIAWCIKTSVMMLDYGKPGNNTSFLASFYLYLN